LALKQILQWAWNGKETRSWAAGDDRWYAPVSTPTASGEEVTPASAQGLSAVYACVRLIRETIASLPVHLMARTQDGARKKRRATEHPLYDILHDTPNPELTSFEFFESLVDHLELRGNAYAFIETSTSGDVLALWPLHPDRMVVERKDRKLIYAWRDNNGTKHPVRADQILHIRQNYDGLIGHSPVEVVREAIGAGMAVQDYGASFFNHGAHFSSIIALEGVMQKDEKAAMKEVLGPSGPYGGARNAGKTVVIDRTKMSVERLSIRPDEAQFLETQKFNVVQIARIFGVPPTMIGDLEKATYSNVEQEMIKFVIHCLRSRIIRIERALERALLQDREKYFVRFNVDALLRGDMQSQAIAFKEGRYGGWLNADDIRDMMDLNPLPNGIGQTYWMPGNMLPAPKAGEPAQPDAENKSTTTNTFIEQRSNLKRLNLRKKFRPVVLEAAGKIVRRIVGELRAATKKHVTNGSTIVFEAFIEDYTRNTVPFIFEDGLKTILTSYASIVSEVVEDALDRSRYEQRELPDFVEAYLKTLGVRRAAALRLKLTKAFEKGDPAAALEELYERWLLGDAQAKALADNITDYELTRLGESVTRYTFRQHGVTKVRWVAGGDACPLCQELDGNVVGIEETFISEGDVLYGKSVAADGKESYVAFKSNGNVFEPPLHDGCNCSITVG